ncbi:MAG: tetratricopeptide repeat protein [Acaryochloridaceae cyanobacterium RL_2_7]|nr:tetratricopeptide repeat protein [Acaryochloridaceae cyanobacterium RL_2_7]
MKLPHTFVIGSVIGLTLTPLLAFAQSIPESSPNRPIFSLPTFERQPLLHPLNTANDWQTVAQNAFLAQDYLNSVAAYGKAIDLAQGSDRPGLLEERGWVLYRLGQFERADQDFRQAAALHLQRQQWTSYNNARQMRQFVGNQAERLDSAS